MIECVCLLSHLQYLWVETEGFGRFANTEQVKDDLLHGKIQSLLIRGETQVLVDFRGNEILGGTCLKDD